MRKETLFEMSSPYRDHFRVQGFRFGGDAPTVAIVGAMRGDEIQQQYICAKMVELLTRLEAEGAIAPDKGVLVIPSCNPFSMNVGRRFWTMDGTDINRMFPGYDQGETTQRIAAAVFKQLQGFEYGLQLASFYVPGEFVPHVRMLRTGYEDTVGARLFGLPFVTVRKPLPFDTTLLNYNWQIWNTKAYSIYAGQTHQVEHRSTELTVEAILRFLHKVGVTTQRIHKAGYESVLLDEEQLVSVSAQRAGIFFRLKGAGEQVAKGDVMARVLDPYEGSVREEVRAPLDGTVFFAHNKPLALEHGLLYRVLGYQ